MADTQPPRVDNEIVQMWRKDGKLYAIAGFIAGVMLFPLLASLGENLAGFLQELAPEAVGILVTVLVIERLNERRSKRDAEKALKQQLVDDAASTSNEIAKNAVHQMKRKGLLEGATGILKGADLSDAKLQGADFWHANLQEADLGSANLQEARLRGANLQDADLTTANLQGADLGVTNLLGADLQGANLQEAQLMGANLQGANFWNANLQGAFLAGANLQEAFFLSANLRGVSLEGAKLIRTNFTGADLKGARYFEGATFWSENMIMPDGSIWTPETDMTRFTDPSHPNFFSADP